MPGPPPETDASLFAQPGERRPALVWLDPRQAAFAAQLVRRAGLSCAPAVFASPPAERMEPSVEADLTADAPAADDLRHAISETDARVCVLLAAGDDRHPLDDPGLLGLLDGRGILTLSVEPLYPSVLAARDAQRAAGRRVVPLLRHAPLFAGAIEAAEQVGQRRTAAIAGRSGRRAGTLAARLFDAMHLLHDLMGTPDSVDAAHAYEAGSGQAQSLRALRGDLTINLRYPGGRAAAAVLSDRAGRWFRGVTLIGDRGCMRLDERGFEVLGPDGEPLDRSAPADVAGHDEAWPDVDAFADQIRRALDPHLPAPPPYDAPAVLGICEAALLSTRTGQAEAPAALIHMAR